MARYPCRDALRARALFALSMMERERNDGEAAGQAAEEGIAIGRELDDVALVAEAMLLRVAAIVYLPNPDDRAVQLAFGEALSLAEANGFDFLIANLLNFRSMYFIATGRFDGVEAALHRARKIAVRLNLVGSHTVVWWALGWIAALRGDDDVALTYLHEALSVNHDAIQQHVAINTLELVAAVLARSGQFAIATQLRALTDRERRLKGRVAATWWANQLSKMVDEDSPLDPTAYDEAWRAGSAMSLEDGIALALEVTDR